MTPEELYPMLEFDWLLFALEYGWLVIILSIALLGATILGCILFMFRDKKRIRGIDR